MKAKISDFIVILLTIALWGLQMLPINSNNQFLKWLKDYALWIGLCLAGIVVVIHVWLIFYNRDAERKKWIRNFFKQVMTEHLGGNNYNTRISMFRARRGYRVFVRYIYYYLILNFFNNFQNKAWGSGFRHIPIHFMSNYLVIYERYSHPKRGKSYTFFRILDEEGKYNGAVEKCYREATEVEVKTSNISDVALKEKFEQMSHRDKRKVEKYMSDSFMDKSCYEYLYHMHIRANNIYAIPIMNDNQSVWGVIAVDNNETKNTSLKAQLTPFIEQYVRIFNYTIYQYV